MKKTALRTLKRILPVLLSLFAVVTAVPTAEALVTEGQCGPDLYWTLENYVLTVSGTGCMYDFDPRTAQNTGFEPPWRSYITSISRVVIEEGCESIGTNAFNKFSTITEIAFPGSSLKTIKESAFQGTGLKKVCIPDCVETIGLRAFSSCENLKEISFGNGLKTVPKYICLGDSSLEKVTFSPSCKTVEVAAFQNCTSLSEANFEPLERIESTAFASCAFSEVRFGKDLKYMQTNVFSGCRSLSSVIFEEGTEPAEVSNQFLNGTPYYTALPSGLYTMFDGKVQMCKGTYTKSSLVIPEGVEIVSDFCFDKAKYLTKLSLPSTLKTICSYAFRDCVKLKSIDLPDSVERLCENCIGIYTNSLSIYTELEDFVITGKGCGAVFEYAALHNFPLNCRHNCSVVYDVDDCSAGGIVYTLCDYCGACLETDPVEPAASHSFEVTTVDPVCGKDGYTLEKCSICGYEQRTAIPATPHTPAGSWTVVSLPDCSRAGSVVRYCTTCGEIAETIILDKEEHTPAAEFTPVKEATCTEPGTEALLCVNCGETISEREIPPRGHVPEDERVEITLPAEDGTLYGCSVLKCRYCSVILDIIWLDADGNPADRTDAAAFNVHAMTEFLCSRPTPASIGSMDYASDGIFNMRDILAIRKLAAIEVRK